MLLLGRQIPDKKALKIILTSFYGIGLPTASRLLARLQFHDTITPSELTSAQTSQLVEFLSSPSTSPKPPLTPVAPPSSTSTSTLFSNKLKERTRPDALSNIKLETDLRREVRENIAHHRTVGSYVGKRHAMGLPVRGQNTRTNARTARKLNKIERRG